MTPERSFNPEIQGLRAIAVGMVLIFHIWPAALPGGYVGVDVFFVISGYLITGLLVRAAIRDGRISLVDFYSRRARRLLPAASLVLAATFAGMFFFLPEARWQETTTEIAASALYVQNWVLAWLSGDYLGADNAASPVQHYWSLSIEEQFYVVWPLVMIASIAVARRAGIAMKRVFFVALGVIFASSFLASILITAADQAQAYFVTHTRMWELAMGGLLALTIHHLRFGMRLRLALLAIGLSAIAVSAFAFSRETAFPGYAALLPTLGTALVIMAGEVRAGRFQGLEATWLSWLGDRSYSIYLWHWPLVVFYVVGGRQIGLMDGIGLLAVTLVISHLSYHLVEQPFRHSRGRDEIRPLVYGLASIAVCVVVPAWVGYGIASQPQREIAVGDRNYPGPAALFGAPVPQGVDLLPSLAALRRDLPVVYLGEVCHQNQTDNEPKHCILGDPEGEITVAITGDSHAAQWVPALERLAAANGWRLVTLTKSACAFARVEVRVSGRIYPSCSQWRENVIEWIKSNGVDIMFTSQSRYGYVPMPEMARGLREIWAELIEAGVKVIPIHDTPWLPFEPGDCLSGTVGACSAPRSSVEAPKTIYMAAQGLAGVDVLDMTDAICAAEVCDVVVGNLIVWRDRHHLTATYAATLASYMAERLDLSFEPSDPKDDSVELVASLTCEALGDGQPIERSITLQLVDNQLVHRFGDWQGRSDRFDDWAGEIEARAVSIRGSYIEGSGGVKAVELAGSIADGRLVLSGTRGPRDCTLVADMPSQRSM